MNIGAVGEPPPQTKSNYSDETLRRTRPLARRRDKTLRPPRVFIRARKPWVLARLRVLGCQVRFIASSKNWVNPGKSALLKKERLSSGQATLRV